VRSSGTQSDTQLAALNGQQDPDRPFNSFNEVYLTDIYYSWSCV